MLSLILTSILLYLSTNIDNLIILLMLYATAKSKKANIHISLGQLIGTFALVLISMVIAMGTSKLPSTFVHMLGVIPILLGLKIIYQNIRNRNSRTNHDESPTLISINIIQVSLITIANGGDNIGVYVPVFTNYGSFEYVITGVVFTVCTLILCYLGITMAAVPEFKKLIESKQHIFVPTTLILLGFIIIFS